MSGDSKGASLRGRSVHRTARCPSCDARLQYGEPSINATWAQPLSLTEYQMNLITLAAAEFDDFAAKFNDRPTAVEFADWLRPDALGMVSLKHPEVDGAMPRYYLSGDKAHSRSADSTHRHPDPLPFHDSRRKAG